MIPLLCGRYCLQPVKVGTEDHICLQPQNALKFKKDWTATVSQRQNSSKGELIKRVNLIYYIYFLPYVSTVRIFQRPAQMFNWLEQNFLIAKKGRGVYGQNVFIILEANHFTL